MFEMDSTSEIVGAEVKTENSTQETNNNNIIESANNNVSPSETPNDSSSKNIVISKSSDIIDIVNEGAIDDISPSTETSSEPCSINLITKSADIVADNITNENSATDIHQSCRPEESNTPEDDKSINQMTKEVSKVNIDTQSTISKNPNCSETVISQQQNTPKSEILKKEEIERETETESDDCLTEDPNEASSETREVIAENNNNVALFESSDTKDDIEDSCEARDMIVENDKDDVTIEFSNAKVEDETQTKPAIFDEKKTEVRQVEKENVNNQIQNIISDIDVNIKAQENITKLKEQELKLIQKQNELASEIQQQQMLAQQLSAQNQVKLKQLEQNTQSEKRAVDLHPSQSNPTYKEYSNASKTVDLRKIFTPATDSEEILPKNRKLYASSAFYSPTLHPTVEDQVELARRISHSLSDISNQTSKGQSMYVNRKKRSVKWVHEGSAQEKESSHDVNVPCKNNSDSNSTAELTMLGTMPLKLIMNPRGQVRDYNSLKELINVESGLLSPDNCAELITALQLHQGRGAELFAKRRKKSDNWVVDDNNTGTQCHLSGIPDYKQYPPKAATSPNILPAYSDAGKHRVQLNIHQNQLIEKYSKPGVQVIKSPWEAALQTGSASTAFLEQPKDRNFTTAVESPIYYLQNRAKDLTDSNIQYPIQKNEQGETKSDYDIDVTARSQAVNVLTNSQRELAYTPSVAQGWGGRNVELPKGLFVPKEISLSSYAPPPKLYTGVSPDFEPSTGSSPNFNSFSNRGSFGTHSGSKFPFTKPYSNESPSLKPPQKMLPATSYKTEPHDITHIATPVNFSPTPLSYDKLAPYEKSQRFENPKDQQYLSILKPSNVRNISPTPFGLALNKPTSRCPSSVSSFGPVQDHSPKTTTSRCDQFINNKTSSTLQQGQSFNARPVGWGPGSNYRKNYQCILQPQNSLPYSDF